MVKYLDYEEVILRRCFLVQHRIKISRSAGGYPIKQELLPLFPLISSTSRLSKLLIPCYLLQSYYSLAVPKAENNP